MIDRTTIMALLSAILFFGGVGLMAVGKIPGVALSVFGYLMFFAVHGKLVRDVRASGFESVIRPLKGNEVVVLFISSTRKIFPLVGREVVYEKFISLPTFGRLKITQNSDYTLPNGRKCVIARAGVGHTIPVEQAEFARELKELGFKDFRELEVFVNNYSKFRSWWQSLTEEEKAQVKEVGPLFVEHVLGGGRDAEETP